MTAPVPPRRVGNPPAPRCVAPRGSGNDQKYGQSLFGLQKDDLTSYNAEISYSPGERLNVFVFADRQDRKVGGARRILLLSSPVSAGGAAWP
ncbi:MAG TPA: hypothetical protein VGQ28_00015 [Thermoanaerobaculia bacterium]|nr:hypothetical protein [Thermoanaerobaculia bacterium]